MSRRCKFFYLCLGDANFSIFEIIIIVIDLVHLAINSIYELIGYFLWLCSELPLEPSLSRMLMEANEFGCLSQALTVAAMLSAETTLLPGRRLVHLESFYCRPLL